ncbi:MAG: GGDEF domain-containing protein [Victivallales bacterium]|nr:GGDEF domain-containing protein [Victivallales bacterium]
MKIFLVTSNTFLGSLILTCVTILIFSFGSSIHAFPTQKLLFLGNENIPPIIYNVNGSAKGVVVDITKAVIKEAKLDAEIKAMNWAEAQALLKKGKADALLQINKNTQREKYLDFSLPLLKSEFCIFKLNSRNDISNLKSLRNKIVGVEKKGYPRQYLKKKPGIKIKIIPDFKTGFRMIKTKEIDAIIVDRWVGEYQLAINNITDISHLEKPIAENYSAIAVLKGNTKLLHSINYGLSKIRENGIRQSILRKWKGYEIIYLTKSRFTLYKNIVIFACICSVLLFIIIFYAYRLYYTRTKLKKVNLSLTKNKIELEIIKDKLKQKNKYLYNVSKTDSLTGLYNRRFFNEAHIRELRRVKRNQYPLSLLMIDVDYFKDYNDKYGHVKGDIALKKVSHVLRISINRPHDIASRYGGEEFVLLLPETPAKNALTLAEKIRNTVLELKIETANKKTSPYLTVSIGIAEVERIQYNIINKIALDQIDNADKAMFLSKSNGRNQSNIYI